MSTGIMRQTVTVLSVVWILWQQFSSGGKGTLWGANQGFETRKACIAAAEKNAPDGDRNSFGIPITQGTSLWTCFPSDFDPRPR